MSCFWADWQLVSVGCLFPVRKDTRIYYHTSPLHDPRIGKCIGSFYGENPGGAVPVGGLTASGWTALEWMGLPGDPTMRLLWEVWDKAIKLGKLPAAGPEDFIEVLNVYYFACGTSAKTLPAWSNAGGTRMYRTSLRATSRFTILGWGKNPGVNALALTQLATVASPGRVLSPDSSFRVSRFPPGTMLGMAFPPAFPNYPVSPSYANASLKLRRPQYLQNVATSL